MRTSALRGIIILFTITFLWGTSFPVIKLIMDGLSPYVYTGLRALASSFAIIPMLLMSFRKRGVDRRSIIGGIMAGAMYSLGIFFQGWGTKYTSASNSAFLTSTSVVMVLMLESLMRRRVAKEVALAGAGAIAGVYILTSPGGDFSIGDFLVLISAIFWALQIMFISYFKFENYVQFVGTMLLVPAAFVALDVNDLSCADVSLEMLLWLAYLGIVVGVITSLGQVIGQRAVSASVSAIIYQLEPLFAYLLSYVFLGESFTVKKGIGALVILASSIYASYYRVKKDTLGP